MCELATVGVAERGRHTAQDNISKNKRNKGNMKEIICTTPSETHSLYVQPSSCGEVIVGAVGRFKCIRPEHPAHGV